MRLSPPVSPSVVAALLGAFAVTGCTRCLADDSRSITETVWADGEDRLVLVKKTFETFPDTTMEYRLRLAHDRERTAVDVMAGRVQIKDFRLRAARLPGGQIAWHTGETLCAEIDAAHTVCNGFQGISCWVSADDRGCCYEVTGSNTSCGCAARAPDSRLADAFEWLAEDREQDARERIVAAVALARLGQNVRAQRLLHQFESTFDLRGRRDQADLWLLGLRANLTGDPETINRLRARFREGSDCDRVAIARACVPQLAAEAGTRDCHR